jgi:hypothetical protein
MGGAFSAFGGEKTCIQGFGGERGGKETTLEDGFGGLVVSLWFPSSRVQTRPKPLDF